MARYLAAGAAADYFFDVRWRKWLTALFFNAFPVDRSGTRPRPGISKTLLEHDVPLLVFPEGARSKDGAHGHFKPGAAALSIVDGRAVPADRARRARRVACRAAQAGPSPGACRSAVVFGAPMSAHEGETAEDFTTRSWPTRSAASTRASARCHSR